MCDGLHFGVRVRGAQGARTVTRGHCRSLGLPRPPHPEPSRLGTAPYRGPAPGIAVLLCESMSLAAPWRDPCEQSPTASALCDRLASLCLRSLDSATLQRSSELTSSVSTDKVPLRAQTTPPPPVHGLGAPPPLAAPLRTGLHSGSSEPCARLSHRLTQAERWAGRSVLSPEALPPSAVPGAPMPGQPHQHLGFFWAFQW